MWIADRGLAEVASWRLATELVRRHAGVEVRWEPGPDGVGYDVMQVTGTGRDGPFHLLLNRAGTVQGWLEDGSGDRAEVGLGWDVVFGARPEDGGATDHGGPEPVGIGAAVARIERALRLVPEETAATRRRAFPVAVMGALAALHVGAGTPVRTHAEWIDMTDRDPVQTRVLVAYPDLLTDLGLMRTARGAPDGQVWVLTAGRDGPAIHLGAGLAWTTGGRGTVDLYEVPDLVGAEPLDAAATAAWLNGPRRDQEAVRLRRWPRPEDEAVSGPASASVPMTSSAPPSDASASPRADAPQGPLGLGVVEAVDDPSERFVIVEGSLERDDTNGDDDPWVTHLTPLDRGRVMFRSWRPPVAGRDAPREGLRFHDGDRAYAFRALRDEDGAWVSRFDVDLTAYDLRQLVSLLGEVRDDADPAADRPWSGFEAARVAAEELVALVAAGGTSVFALHHMLLDGRRVVVPSFRDEGEWTDEIPYMTDLWQAEAHRVIDEGLATPDPEHLMEDEDPTDDPFMLLGVAEYLQIHPTMARAFMELFDRGHPIPASVARLAEGHADDPVRPAGAGGWESEPWASASSGSPSSDALRRRTEPMRRIDLMRVLYDISVEFSSRR